MTSSRNDFWMELVCIPHWISHFLVFLKLRSLLLKWFCHKNWLLFHLHNKKYCKKSNYSIRGKQSISIINEDLMPKCNTKVGFTWKRGNYEIILVYWLQKFVKIYSWVSERESIYITQMPSLRSVSTAIEVVHIYTRVSRGAICFSEEEYSGGSTASTSTGKYSGGFWPSVSICRATWYGGGGSYAGGVE